VAFRFKLYAKGLLRIVHDEEITPDKLGIEPEFLSQETYEGEKSTPQIRSAPRLLRVMGRPNSPPPELLNAKVRPHAWDVNPPFVPFAGTK